MSTVSDWRREDVDDQPTQINLKKSYSSVFSQERRGEKRENIVNVYEKQRDGKTERERIVYPQHGHTP